MSNTNARVPDLKRLLATGSDQEIDASDFTDAEIRNIASATTSPTAGKLTVRNAEGRNNDALTPTAGIPPIGCPTKVLFVRRQ
jgi:hypothetical protein